VAKGCVSFVGARPAGWRGLGAAGSMAG
jgi:hypothetical protein